MGSGSGAEGNLRPFFFDLSAKGDQENGMGSQSVVDRRRFGWGVVAIGLSPCLSSAERKSALVNFSPDHPVEIDPATGVDASQRMTALVRINGRGPFEFVVDTGANRTVVSREVADALGLPDAGVAEVHGVTGVEPVQTALVRRLQIDALQTEVIRAPVLPRKQLGADGLLGVDALRNRRVLMNFRDNQLSIDRDPGSSPLRSPVEARRNGPNVSRKGLGQRVVVPARYRFGQLIILGADVSGRPVTAFIDSGSQSTVGNRALQHAAYGGGGDVGPRALQYRVPILSATGQTSEGDVGALPLLKIGGLTMSGLVITYADLHIFTIWDLWERPSLLLGMDVLRQFNAMELNYARREVAFYLASRARR